MTQSLVTSAIPFELHRANDVEAKLKEFRPELLGKEGLIRIALRNKAYISCRSLWSVAMATLVFEMSAQDRQPSKEGKHEGQGTEVAIPERLDDHIRSLFADQIAKTILPLPERADSVHRNDNRFGLSAALGNSSIEALQTRPESDECVCPNCLQKIEGGKCYKINRWVQKLHHFISGFGTVSFAKNQPNFVVMPVNR